MRKARKDVMALAMMMGLTAIVLCLPGLIYAGDLEPSAPPGPTMHTLDEIYNGIVNNYNAIMSQCGSGGCDGAPVEKTGQTDCWDTSGTSIPCADTGQDGDLQKGVAWPDPRFTDNADGTVTDNLTGLIWLKNASCFGQKNWSTALTDCNSLANGACSLTDGSVAGDWRLPNLFELESLRDMSNYNPALPSGHPFTSVVSGFYWSGTTNADDTNVAWDVNLYNGSMSSGGKADNLYAWPVRGGQ